MSPVSFGGMHLSLSYLEAIGRVDEMLVDSSNASLEAKLRPIRANVSFSWQIQSIKSSRNRSSMYSSDSKKCVKRAIIFLKASIIVEDSQMDKSSLVANLDISDFDRMTMKMGYSSCRHRVSQKSSGKSPP